MPSPLLAPGVTVRCVCPEPKWANCRCRRYRLNTGTGVGRDPWYALRSNYAVKRVRRDWRCRCWWFSTWSRSTVTKSGLWVWREVRSIIMELSKTRYEPIGRWGNRRTRSRSHTVKKWKPMDGEDQQLGDFVTPWYCLKSGKQKCF